MVVQLAVVILDEGDLDHSFDHFHSFVLGHLDRAGMRANQLHDELLPDPLSRLKDTGKWGVRLSSFSSQITIGLLTSELQIFRVIGPVDFSSCFRRKCVRLHQTYKVVD